MRLEFNTFNNYIVKPTEDIDPFSLTIDLLMDVESFTINQKVCIRL